ncbi:hypothetical protein F5984_23555 [Rudanella paleaurantiibacter]|uniref:Uncharacterized protein n=1 Tax=Rudanella paleaurantiibacter TaxID=2614655 RepID=A0A7J5TTI5_9BACT|nr:hypothetical protein [Rudanella paleaurantiibacter]KAB7726889.1 hypothetical protein F5984_23555 [Rudanella paleaurantiibacter]
MAKTTNILSVNDNQGIPLACSRPKAGQHNDLFAIEEQFGDLCAQPQVVSLRVGGLFLKADAGFASSQ